MNTDEKPTSSHAVWFPRQICPGCVMSGNDNMRVNCQICGRPIIKITPKPQLAFLVRLVNWLIRPIGKALYVTTLLAFGVSIFSAAHNWVPFGPNFFFWLLWFAVAVCWFPRFLARIIAFLLQPATGLKQPGWMGYILILVSFGLVMLLGRPSVSPMVYVAFNVSRGFLESVVEEPASGGKLGEYPQFAGLYRVLYIQHQNQNTRLTLTTGLDWLDEMYAGLAKCSGSCPPFDLPGEDSHGSPGDTEYLPLGDGWYWWTQSGGYSLD